jgi:hypothetical protein
MKITKHISALLWHAPDYFSKWRIFPRAFIGMYIWLFYSAATWFMALPAPTNSQSAFVSVIIGAGAAWFGLYVNSGGQPGSGPAINPYEQASIVRTRTQTQTQTNTEFSFEQETAPQVAPQVQEG